MAAVTVGQDSENLLAIFAVHITIILKEKEATNLRIGGVDMGGVSGKVPENG